MIILHWQNILFFTLRINAEISIVSNVLDVLALLKTNKFN